MTRLFALSLLLSVLAVQNSYAQDDSSAKAIIRAAFEASAAAWNNADINGHVAMYADSAAFMTGNGPAIGRERTAELLEGAYFQDGAPLQQLGFDHLTVRMLGENHAMAIGHFLLSGSGLDDATGWFTTIWERTEHRWEIIHDHSS